MENIQLSHIHHYEKNKKISICFLAHNIDVPMNIGSLFRIADALGIEKIYLSGTSPIPPNSKIRKTSRATEKYVPYSYSENPLDVIKKVKSNGYTVISLELTSSSIDIAEIELKNIDKICLILGSENSGICQELLNESDITIHIPMMRKNSSMNVAMASAIAAYELTSS